MEHLSIEKIIRFITFKQMTQSNMSLSAEVNSHMVKCPECRKKVQTISDIHDSLTGRKEGRFADPVAEEEVRALLDQTNSGRV